MAVIHMGTFTNKNLASPINFYDERLHPKEIVLGFESDNNFKSFQLETIEASTVTNDKIDSKEILIISIMSYMARAFDRTVNDQVLEFEYFDEKIIDKQTGSRWSIDGKSVSGEFEGEQLQRAVYDLGFWFEWSSLHPTTEVN